MNREDISNARNNISNACAAWLRSEEVDELMRTMDPKEKRAIGRMADSDDMPNYFDGLTDALDLFGIGTSASFSRFLNELAERL